MFNWSSILAVVALTFSAVCFYLFVLNAIPKPVPDKVVEDAARKAEARSLSPGAIGGLAKALAEAFSKVGPAALGLIGALLFFLLAGEAAQVFHLTDASEKSDTARTDGGTKGQGNKPTGAASGKDSEVAKPVGNSQ